MDSWISRHGGGRRPQLTPGQTKRLGELSEAGPPVVGLETACWHAVCIRGLLWRACGVLDNRPAVGTVLHPWGFALQKARFVSEHLDAAQRLAGLEPKGSTMVRAAQRRQGLLLFEAAVRLAQGGSLRDTWARRGRPPAVPTRGKRQGYPVCGAIAYVSGCLC